MVQSIMPNMAFDAAAAATFSQPLTPDALMTYLSTRLDGLDTQVNAIFNRQQHTQAIQKALATLRAALGQVKTDNTSNNGEALAAVHKALHALTDLDRDLGTVVIDQLQQPGFALDDHTYKAVEMKATTDYLDGVVKDIDSSAQMDMIRLQSIMSARQTAIQLSTNLVSALSESTKAIVANIGR